MVGRGHGALLWSLCLLSPLQRLPAIYRTRWKPLEPGITTQYDLTRLTPASPASALVPLVPLLMLPWNPLVVVPVLPTHFLLLEIPSFQDLLKGGFS